MIRYLAASAFALACLIAAPTALSTAGATEANVRVHRAAPAARYQPRPRFSHRFQRPHRHGHRGFRKRRIVGIAPLYGPAVINRYGAIENLPAENEILNSIPQEPVRPVIHRLGTRGDCHVEQVRVPGTYGRTTVNLWRC
jgi:hypothetical protein